VERRCAAGAACASWRARPRSPRRTDGCWRRAKLAAQPVVHRPPGRPVNCAGVRPVSALTALKNCA
jgi:hypothetical protein